MSTVTFFGFSDDLVDVDGDVAGCDEYAVPYPEDRLSFRVRHVADDGAAAGLVVHVRYEQHGCWSVGVSQLDEDVDLPDWNLRISGSGYSARLSIDVPDGAVVEPLPVAA